MFSDASHMLAVKATFDGQRIALSDDVRGVRPGKVIVIFEDTADGQDESLWHKATEAAFAKAWENPENEVYDYH